MPTKLTNQIITAAIEGFEARRKRIDEQIAELRGMLSDGSVISSVRAEAPARKRRKFSAATRRKMALAQKARWTKIEVGSEPAPSAPPVPRKTRRKLSAAGRKAIQEAQRRRWAQKRAEDARAKKAAPANRRAAAKKAA